VVDPAVSRLKFDREIAKYTPWRQTISAGMVDCPSDFPEVFVISARASRTSSVVLELSSTSLTTPLAPVGALGRIRSHGNRTGQGFSQSAVARPAADAPGDIMAYLAAAQRLVQLMVAAEPDEIPFLCLPGIREYHENPAHTGDSWLLHRGGRRRHIELGVASALGLWREPIDGYQMNIQVGIRWFRPVTGPGVKAFSISGDSRAEAPSAGGHTPTSAPLGSRRHRRL